MGSFSYTLDASFGEKLTLLVLVLMWRLCYSLHASFSLEEFLLRLLLLILQWVSFTSLMMIVLAKSNSLDNWPETKNKTKTKTKLKKKPIINYPPPPPPQLMGWVGVGVGAFTYTRIPSSLQISSMQNLQIIIHSLPAVKQCLIAFFCL